MDYLAYPTKLANKAFGFFRTKIALSNLPDELTALVRAFQAHPEIRDRELLAKWRNGFALEIEHMMTFDSLTRAVRPAADLFDAWMMHDLRSSVAESGPFGPGGVFYDETSPAKHSRIADVIQAFIRVRAGDRFAQQASDLITAALGRSAKAVFHLEDGKIIAARSDQPVQTIYRRFERQLGSLRSHLIKGTIVDCHGGRLHLHRMNPLSSYDDFDSHDDFDEEELWYALNPQS